MGRYDTCSIELDATVRCWGDDSFGELGDGHDRAADSRVVTPPVTQVTGIATGVSHTCVLRRDHAVLCFGDNRYGQLGDGTTTSSSVPVAVHGLDDATSIDSSGFDTCAVRSGGSVDCWGRNNRAPTTRAPARPGFQAATGRRQDVRVPVAVAPGDPALDVSSGLTHTCEVDVHHHALCWGGNRYWESGSHRFTG